VPDLPDEIGLDELPPGSGLVLGVTEQGLPWAIDPFGADPHLLVLGDAESGKTNLLRALGRTLAAGRRARVEVVDYRRRLSRDPALAAMGRAGTPAEAAQLAARVLKEIEQAESRGEPPSEPVVLLVDDYDLVAGHGGNPLAPLVDIIARGRDVGFHLVVARRIGGVSRSSFEPVYQRLRDLGTPGLVLSGDPTEGIVLGSVRAAIRPPGRGMWVRRGVVTEVQVAVVEQPAAVHHLDRWAG
jgi:S-DNA-T family DNA segregation ATPase FtsK/SpoIIIE